MLETHRYIRKPLSVLAVRVNGQNMREVAAWCGGAVKVSIVDDNPGPRYIQVNVHNPIGERQTQAFSGDWVLKGSSGFKVFLDKAFRMSFDQSSTESIMQETRIDAEPPTTTVGQAMRRAMEAPRKPSDKKPPRGKRGKARPPKEKNSDVKVIDNAKIESVSLVTDPPHPSWKIESVDGVTPAFSDAPQEVRTIENSFDRVTGLPATVRTPPEDLVPIPGAEDNNPKETPMGNGTTYSSPPDEPAQERQDPAEPKRIDESTDTTPQNPAAEPVEVSPEDPGDAPVEVAPDNPEVSES